jgi:hypothetical protein
MEDVQTVTIAGIDRAYNRSWDGEDRKDLAKGNASVRKVDITDGNSKLKVIQDETGTIEKHIVQLRDKRVLSGNPSAEVIEQISVTATHKTDDPLAIARCKALLKGLAAKLQTDAFLDAFLAGQM